MSTILQPMTLAEALHVAHELSADERKVWETLRGETFDPDRAAVAMYQQVGMNWSIISEAPAGHLLAVGGVHRVREGVMRSWFMAPDWVWAEYGKDLTQQVKFVAARLLADGLAHRIETVTLASQTRARRWYEMLGLTLESTLRGYCPNGDDAVMYVALRPAEKL